MRRISPSLCFAADAFCVGQVEGSNCVYDATYQALPRRLSGMSPGGSVWMTSGLHALLPHKDSMSWSDLPAQDARVLLASSRWIWADCMPVPHTGVMEVQPSSTFSDVPRRSRSTARCACRSKDDRWRSEAVPRSAVRFQRPSIL